MKETMELLNVMVGFELVIIGVIYLAHLDITSAASWFIFGCMYIVMDKYSVLKGVTTKRRLIERVKMECSVAWICRKFILSRLCSGFDLGRGST